MKTSIILIEEITSNQNILNSLNYEPEKIVVAEDTLNYELGDVQHNLLKNNGLNPSYPDWELRKNNERKHDVDLIVANGFNFHVGGYLNPYYAMRQIEIPINKLQNQINLTVDLERFFSEINLKEMNSVMIPGNDAMALANLSSKMFYIE